MNNSDEDRRRVRAMLAGHSTAFDAFFTDYFPRLYRFVLPRVEHNHAAAQDICQDALSQAVRRLASYRGEAALFTWLCQIARNTLADYWQRQKRERAHVVYSEDDAAIRAVLESLESNALEGPEARRYGEELGRAVQVVLDHLPGHYGDALEWKYLDGLSIAEIAARLGASPIAAQSILQRARNAFREAFGALAADVGSRSL